MLHKLVLETLSGAPTTQIDRNIRINQLRNMIFHNFFSPLCLLRRIWCIMKDKRSESRILYIKRQASRQEHGQKIRLVWADKERFLAHFPIWNGSGKHRDWKGITTIYLGCGVCIQCIKETLIQIYEANLKFHAGVVPLKNYKFI